MFGPNLLPRNAVHLGRPVCLTCHASASNKPSGFSSVSWLWRCASDESPSGCVPQKSSAHGSGVTAPRCAVALAMCLAPRVGSPMWRDSARRCIGCGASWRCRTTGGCAVGALRSSVGGPLGLVVARPGECLLGSRRVRRGGGCGGVGVMGAAGASGDALCVPGPVCAVRAARGGAGHCRRLPADKMKLAS